MQLQDRDQRKNNLKRTGEEIRCEEREKEPEVQKRSKYSSNNDDLSITSRSNIACQALRIVLQHSMNPDLGWTTIGLEQRQLELFPEVVALKLQQKLANLTSNSSVSGSQQSRLSADERDAQKIKLQEEVEKRFLSDPYSIVSYEEDLQYFRQLTESINIIAILIENQQEINGAIICRLVNVNTIINQWIKTIMRPAQYLKQYQMIAFICDLCQTISNWSRTMSKLFAYQQEKWIDKQSLIVFQMISVQNLQSRVDSMNTLVFSFGLLVSFCKLDSEYEVPPDKMDSRFCKKENELHIVYDQTDGSCMLPFNDAIVYLDSVKDNMKSEISEMMLLDSMHDLYTLMSHSFRFGVYCMQQVADIYKEETERLKRCIISDNRQQSSFQKMFAITKFQFHSNRIGFAKAESTLLRFRKAIAAALPIYSCYNHDKLFKDMTLCNVALSDFLILGRDNMLLQSPINLSLNHQQFAHLQSYHDKLLILLGRLFIRLQQHEQLWQKLLLHYNDDSRKSLLRCIYSKQIGYVKQGLAMLRSNILINTLEDDINAVLISQRCDGAFWFASRLTPLVKHLASVLDSSATTTIFSVIERVVYGAASRFCTTHKTSQELMNRSIRPILLPLSTVAKLKLKDSGQFDPAPIAEELSEIAIQWAQESATWELNCPIEENSLLYPLVKLRDEVLQQAWDCLEECPHAVCCYYEIEAEMKLLFANCFHAFATYLQKEFVAKLYEQYQVEEKPDDSNYAVICRDYQEGLEELYNTWKIHHMNSYITDEQRRKYNATIKVLLISLRYTLDGITTTSISQCQRFRFTDVIRMQSMQWNPLLTLNCAAEIQRKFREEGSLKGQSFDNTRTLPRMWGGAGIKVNKYLQIWSTLEEASSEGQQVDDGSPIITNRHLWESCVGCVCKYWESIQLQAESLVATNNGNSSLDAQVVSDLTALEAILQQSYDLIFPYLMKGILHQKHGTKFYHDLVDMHALTSKSSMDEKAIQDIIGALIREGTA